MDVGKRFVAGKSWQAALLLEVGAELAVAVNKVAGLSGQQKSELVCSLVLPLLDDAEKADKTAQEESIAKGETRVPMASEEQWLMLKSLVKTVLPATLSLLVGAARGKLDLSSSEQVAVVAEVASGCFSFLCHKTEQRVLSPLAQKPAPGPLRLAIPPQQVEQLPPKEQVTQPVAPTVLQ